MNLVLLRLLPLFIWLSQSILASPLCAVAGRESSNSSQVQPFGKVVKKIQIGPLKHTRPETILRELSSREGEIYSARNAQRDLEALDRLRIFSEIRIVPQVEEEYVNLNINVRETFPYLPTASIDLSDERGFSIGPGFKALNLSGRAIQLSTAARFGESTILQATLEDPWFAGHRWSYRLDSLFLKGYNELDRFDEESLDLQFRLQRYLGKDGRIGGRVGFLTLSSDTPGITLSEDNRDDIPILAGFLGYDSRNKLSNPTRGWWSEFDISRYGLGGDSEFWSFNFDIRRYQPITDRHSLAFFSLTTLRTGRVGSQVPIHLDFHLGGTNTIRGWDVDSILGKNQFINTAEYRYTLMEPRALGFKGFTIYLGLQLAAFGDLGLAWDESEEFALDNFIGGLGFGFRVLVPFVDVIRIDFAFGQSGEGLRPFVGILEKASKQRERTR